MSVVEDRFSSPKFTSVGMRAWQNEEDDPYPEGVVLSWIAEGIGFGEITFARVRDGVGWEVSTERMGKDFVKKVLEHFLAQVREDE